MTNESKGTPAIKPFAAGCRAYVFQGCDSRVDVFRRLLMQVYADSRIREPDNMIVVLLDRVVNGFDCSVQFKAMLASVKNPNLLVLGSDRQNALRGNVLPFTATEGELASFEAPDGDIGLTVRGIEAENQWTMRLCEDAMGPSSTGGDDDHEPLLGPRAGQESESLHEAEQLLRAILSASEPAHKTATNDKVKHADPAPQANKRGRNLRNLGIAAALIACLGFFLAHISDERIPQASRIRSAAAHYDVAELMDVRHPVSAPVFNLVRAIPPEADTNTHHEPRLASEAGKEDRHAPVTATEPDSVADHSPTELALSLPPDATVAVHLTGTALEDALAKDRIATRKLNVAQLARSASDPQ